MVGMKINEWHESTYLTVRTEQLGVDAELSRSSGVKLTLMVQSMTDPQY